MENQITPDFSAVLRQAPASEQKEMLSVSFDSSGFARIRINASSLSILQTCPRKAYYLLNQKWKARTQSPALTFGLGVHAALDVFYGTPRAERAELPSDFADRAALIPYEPDAVPEHWAYRAVSAFVRKAEALRALPDTDKRSLSAGIWLLGHYFRTYWHDTYIIARDEQGPLIERTFAVPLLETKQFYVELFGTIDKVLLNEANGETLPADHKTSSRMGADFLNRVKPNHQYTSYLIGVQHALGLQTENFLIDGIQVKAKPLTALGGPPTFTRQVTKRTEADFAEFRDVVRNACENYLRWVRTEVWPLGSVDSCAMWGGCPFLTVCSAPNSLRNNILEGSFERAKPQ